MNEGIDISIILNAHNEGSLAHVSVLSAKQAIAEINKIGVKTEQFILLDSSNIETEEYFKEFKEEDFKLVKVDYKDPGISRNYGVSLASGKYVAFLDCDDLWGESWLLKAFEFSERDGRDIICHPEMNFYFDNANYVFLHQDSESFNFSPWSMASENHWTSLIFMKRALYLKFPQKASEHDKGIGFEDWDMHCTTLGKGIPHKVIPGTVHFIRCKNNGVTKKTAEYSSLVRPSELFWNLIKEEK